MTTSNTVVTWGRTMYGGSARMGARTAAHLDYTNARLAKRHPGARLRIIQSAYNSSVRASAGTHDKDGCLDVFIQGLDWWDQQRFLRECGWAAWYRYRPMFPEHIHMISLGCTGPLGIYVPGQVADYYNHRSGLVGHSRDSSWFPSNIAATVFDYPAWVKQVKEDNMSHVQKCRAALVAAEKAAVEAHRELKLVHKKYTRIRANSTGLWVIVVGLRALIKRMPK